MILFTHVASSILGILGAYLSNFTYLFKPEKSKRINYGSYVAWIGMILIVISGIFLFLNDIPKFSHSSKFLSNMTVLAVLLIISTFKRTALTAFISIYSWTWILLVAPHEPLPFTYISIVVTYAITLALASVIFLKLYFRSTSNLT